MKSRQATEISKTKLFSHNAVFRKLWIVARIFHDTPGSETQDELFQEICKGDSHDFANSYRPQAIHF